MAADGADLPLSSHDLHEEINLPDISKAGHHVAYVGALYKGKGMEIVLPLAHSCPDVNFHIVGGRMQDIEHWKAKAAGLKNSILCDPDDTEAWQAGLRRLLSDRELASQLTFKAFADLTEKYTWSKRAVVLLAFIKSRL